MLSVDIKKKLGDFELNVAFETEDEVMALLGASGCGKSMTLKCIAGIEKPDSGRIVLNDRVLFDSEAHVNLTPQERQVGYLFQQYALFPNMTVEQNIMLGAHKKPKEERSAIAKAQIKAFRLDGLEKHYPHQLSGGQMQRTALARIMAAEPEILLLDEPFSALDSYLKWQLEMEMSDTLKAFGRDVIFVSHSRDEVCRLCGTVCVLTNGSSDPKESVTELMQTPGTVGAALLSGCKNFSKAERLDDHHVRCLEWGVDLETGAAVPADMTFAGIRAHYFKLSYDKNPIPTHVERVVEDAFSTILMLSTPGGSEGRSLLRLELDKGALSGIRMGDDLTVYIAPEDVMLLSGTGLQ
ncbi:MAG: ATP-binding cassette domain-containing protein [Lachnospiraceae bacterium]|nr:ATP-binding cassette domain-containing protein [Lachnospiraceae bacterium]